jgi:hypothetical protein
MTFAETFEKFQADMDSPATRRMLDEINQMNEAAKKALVDLGSYTNSALSGMRTITDDLHLIKDLGTLAADKMARDMEAMTKFADTHAALNYRFTTPPIPIARPLPDVLLMPRRRPVVDDGPEYSSTSRPELKRKIGFLRRS